MTGQNSAYRPSRWPIPGPGPTPRARQGEHAVPLPVRHFEARLVATGPDEAQAIEALSALVARKFEG